MQKYIVCLLLVWTGVVGMGLAEESRTPSEPLKLSISSDDGIVLTNGFKHLRFAFTNISSERVRIVRDFEHRNLLGLWLYVHAKRADGKGFSSTRILKAQIRRELNYLVLDPQEAFSLRVNMADVGLDLAPGIYMITAQYMNQYGDNCFQGMLESNALELTLK